MAHERCPDCRKKAKHVGWGSMAVKTLVSSAELFMCGRSHVWARCAPPVILETADMVEEKGNG